MLKSLTSLSGTFVTSAMEAFSNNSSASVGSRGDVISMLTAMLTVSVVVGGCVGTGVGVRVGDNEGAGEGTGVGLRVGE